MYVDFPARQEAGKSLRYTLRENVLKNIERKYGLTRKCYLCIENILTIPPTKKNHKIFWICYCTIGGIWAKTVDCPPKVVKCRKGCPQNFEPWNLVQHSNDSECGTPFQPPFYRHNSPGTFTTFRIRRIWTSSNFYTQYTLGPSIYTHSEIALTGLSATCAAYVSWWAARFESTLVMLAAVRSTTSP